MPFTREILWAFAGVLAFLAMPYLFGSYGLYLGSSLCVWIMFALAFDLAYGRTGLLSFGHAMFFGLGAYGLVIMTQTHGLGFWWAILGTLLITAIFAGIVGTVALRVTGHAFVVITVIFSAIVELLAYSRRDITYGEDGISFRVSHVPLGFFDLDITGAWSKYALLFGFLIITFLLLNWINRSSFGLSLRAVRENPARATLLGYPVQRYKLAAFTISGALSGLAGSLFGLLNFHVSAETFHIITSIHPLIAVLVGGAGTMLGPVVGASFIFLLSDHLRTLFVYAEFVIGLILVLTVLFAPQGIVGLMEKAKRHWQARRNADETGEALDMTARFEERRS